MSHDWTRAELVGMVEHLAHETQQLEQLYVALPRGWATTVVENAVVTAFLLSARNLTHFYVPPPKKSRHGNDLYAHHYLPEWNVTNPSNTQELKVAISTKMAHLARGRLEKVEWYPQPIVEMLGEVKAIFLDGLDEPWVSEFARYGMVRTPSNGTV